MFAACPRGGVQVCLQPCDLGGGIGRSAGDAVQLRRLLESLGAAWPERFERRYAIPGFGAFDLLIDAVVEHGDLADKLRHVARGLLDDGDVLGFRDTVSAQNRERAAGLFDPCGNALQEGFEPRRVGMLPREQGGFFVLQQCSGDGEVRRPGMPGGELTDPLPVVRHPRGDLAAGGASKFGVAVGVEERVGRDRVGERLDLFHPLELALGDGQIFSDALDVRGPQITQAVSEQPGQAVVLACHDGRCQLPGKVGRRRIDAGCVPPQPAGANRHRLVQPDLLVAGHIDER